MQGNLGVGAILQKADLFLHNAQQAVSGGAVVVLLLHVWEDLWALQIPQQRWYTFLHSVLRKDGGRYVWFDVTVRPQGQGLPRPTLFVVPKQHSTLSKLMCDLSGTSNWHEASAAVMS